MLMITRVANAIQLISGRNIRPLHRTRATYQPVMPQHCRDPGKQPNLDQAKELGTRQSFNAKPPFVPAARTQGQTREEVSAAVVRKSQLPQIAQAAAPPGAEIFFDESLSPISSADLKEIHSLARFLPVIVLIPKSAAADQVAWCKLSLAKSSSERSETPKLLGVLGKAVERFTSGGSTVIFPPWKLSAKARPLCSRPWSSRR